MRSRPEGLCVSQPTEMLAKLRLVICQAAIVPSKHDAAGAADFVATFIFMPRKFIDKAERYP
jgi:hypothetical protein